MSLTAPVRLRVLPKLIPLDGKSVEMQATDTALQWRLVGSDTWTDVVPLSDITGPQGPKGDTGQDGTMASVVAGLNVSIDSTDPANPIISAAGDVASTATDASTFGFVAGKDSTPADTSKVLPTVERVDAETVYKAADRTALANLTPADHSTAFVEASADQSLWRATTDDISAEITAADPRYVAASGDATGASGGFLMAGAIPTGSFFADDTPAARIHRLADRLFLGDAAVNAGNLTAANDFGSWLYDKNFGATATATLQWMEKAARFASVTSRGIAVTGAARATPGTGAAFGGVFYGYAMPGGTANEVAYGLYVEGNRADGGATTYGMELGIANLGASPAGTNPYTPFGAIHGAAGGAGNTQGLFLEAGADPTVHPTVYDVDVALTLENNGAKFLTGINIADNALYRDGAGRAYAWSVGRGHLSYWYDDASVADYAPAFVFGSVKSNSSYYQELIADDTGLVVRDGSDVEQFRVAITGGGTGIGVYADAAPLIKPLGTADANMRLSGVGVGGVFLQDNSGNNRISVNPTGVAFFDASPVVKQEVAGSTAGNAALISLLAKLANYGLITNSTTA